MMGRSDPIHQFLIEKAAEMVEQVRMQEAVIVENEEANLLALDIQEKLLRLKDLV